MMAFRPDSVVGWTRPALFTQFLFSPRVVVVLVIEVDNDNNDDDDTDAIIYRQMYVFVAGVRSDIEKM